MCDSLHSGDAFGYFVCLCFDIARLQLVSCLSGPLFGGPGVWIMLYICFWSYTGLCVLPLGVVLCSVVVRVLGGPVS